MTFKFTIILALIAASSAAPIAVQYQPATPVYKQLSYEHEAPAEYQFNYAVHDEHTGDIKSQEESRHGDQVRGQYSLIDSDGFKRIVEYSVDGLSGFNAVVHREPTSIQIPQPAPQKNIAHAPLNKFAYAAPVTKLAVAHSAYPTGAQVSFSGAGHNYAY